MGHEFSHIVNGDMRLNLRLIGMVYGILVVAMIGYYMLAMPEDEDDVSNELFSEPCVGKPWHRVGGFWKTMLGASGAALCAVGYIGVVFGNLIKSAVSRQREFLADASAVQYTRYPAGIVGAMKKMGGLPQGSRIRHPQAAEISHMFFGDACAGSFLRPVCHAPAVGGTHSGDRTGVRWPVSKN